MPKQTITIDVDVPTGFRAVGYDRPKKGDHFLNEYRNVLFASSDFVRCAYLLLAKDPPKPEWPDWLTCAAITMDEDGDVFMHDRIPKRGEMSWDSDGYQYFTYFLDVGTPPGIQPILDWMETVGCEEALLINPNFS